MMIARIKQMYTRINSYVSLKYTLIYFSLMALLYMFSLFGSMFGTTDFTYAEF